MSRVVLRFHGLLCDSVYARLRSVTERKTGGNNGQRPRRGQKPVSLKELAELLGLAPATVSLVINRSSVADSIPQETKDRIFRAVRKYNYRPNFFARSLRAQRTFTIGVIVPEVSEGYSAHVMRGVEDHLLQEGYFYFVASHRHRADLIDEYPRLFVERSVDGLIAVDTRWTNIQKVASRLGLTILPSLVVQLQGDSPSPQIGFTATEKLLKSGRDFTALFAFNDISAIGAIRALREAGLRVPEDVSVVGFDDIQSAAYQNPGLTTVRQPLREMGRIAAETLLRRIRQSGKEPHGGETMVEPELIVRESTCPVPAKSRIAGQG